MKKIIFAILMCLTGTDALAQSVKVENINVIPGELSTIDVVFSGVGNCIAAGCSLVMPEEAYQTGEDGFGFGSSTEAEYVVDHIIASKQLDRQTGRIAIYSPTNSVFPGGKEDGERTFRLQLSFMAYDMPPGNYQAQIKNIELALTGNRLVRLQDVPFNLNVQPSSIQTVLSSDDDTNWYDVSGRKLANKPTKKGVYVKQGKKVTVKKD